MIPSGKIEHKKYLINRCGFLTLATDRLLNKYSDEYYSEPIVKLLQLYRKVKVKTEVHLYVQGKHVFNMGKRSKLQSINTWP